jgi:hypothetical protein
MSNRPTGAFGGGKAAPDSKPAIFDYRDRIVILTPVFAWQCHEAFRRCMDAVRTVPQGRFRMEDGSVEVLPIVAEFLTLPNDSHIDRARNTLSHLFLRTPYRFALWIDSDIEIQPEHVVRLWQHLMHGRKFVCGLYAMKTIVPTFVANVKRGATVDQASGLIELNDGGTGCMALDRCVYDTLRAVFPERAYRFASNAPFPGEETFAYFTSGVVQRNGAGDWLSEDWKFCHDWKVAGGTVWGDTAIKLHHWGPMCFPPTVGEIVEALRVLCKQGSTTFPPELAGEARPALEALHEWCTTRAAQAQKEAA